MNATSLPPELIQSLQKSANAFVATKYFAATGLICVLYDHMLTFDTELTVIWREECPMVTKVVYFLCRYVIEGMLIATAYFFVGLRPLIDDRACHIFVGVFCAGCVVWSFMANMYIAFRLYGIWDQRKIAIKTIIGSFLVCYVPFFVFGVIFVTEYVQNVRSLPIKSLNICYVHKQSRALIVSWACTFAFDCFTIGHAFLNALDRPRRQNSDLLKTLRRDGAIFFVGLAFLRLINLIVTVVLPPLEVWVIYFLLWALIALTLTRLILGVESLRSYRGGINTWRPAENSFEMGHWSIGSTGH